MTTRHWRAGALALGLALAGCGTVEVQPQTELPPPLIDQLPATVGVHYPPEFRSYVHKESRYQVDYEISLGPAHVAKLTRLLQAMFARVVEVEDPAHPRAADPSIVMVLEPRFEDYAFLTPRDMVGDAYTVTIRYRLNLYDPEGARVDGYVFTGYGRQKSGSMSGSGPLVEATQRAMRDAGAKLAVELPEQDSVRLLLAGEKIVVKRDEEQARREALGSFGNGPAAASGGGETAGAPGAPAATTTGSPGETQTSSQPPGTEAGPGEGAASEPVGPPPAEDSLPAEEGPPPAPAGDPPPATLPREPALEPAAQPGPGETGPPAEGA